MLPANADPILRHDGPAATANAAVPDKCIVRNVVMLFRSIVR